ncbi:MAG: TonB-dependent receptor [Bacteroidota bacterium]
MVTLNGKVSIANSDQAAANVTVFVDELKRGALTDDDGNYTIELPVGTYTLIFSSLTHLDERYNIRVTSGENIFNVEMFEKTLQLEDIVISAESIENNVSSTEVGKVVMTVNSIKKLPTFLGEVDISKIVKALPGVQSVGEGASGFNVRGGNIDQNLILMDGMPIFNSSHLLGFFSVYNPDLVSTFSLYKGSIPARFGGRISSVLEVNMKNPDDQNFSFQGGVGPVISKLSANIPIVKDKAALNVGTRFGYPTWIIQNFESNVNDNSADYYDINLKYQHKLSSNDVVNISGYISNDNFGFGPDSTFSYSTKAVSINWAHNFSNKLSSQVTAYMSDYEASLDDETENVESFLENGIKTWGGKIDFLYDLNNSLSFNAGIDFQNYEFNPGKRTPATSSSDVREIAIDQQKALESALFVDAEYNVSPRFSIAGGIRFSQFFNVGPASEVVFDPFRPRSNVSIIDTLNNSSGIYRTFTGFEPRLSGTLKLNAISSIKASYTRNFQYIYLFSNSTATLPTDVWRPSDNNIKPQQSDQWTLGYVRSLKDNTYQFSIDAFYKDVNQTAEVALGAEVLLNELLVSDIQSAEGRAYGAEILMRKAKGKVTVFQNVRAYNLANR